MIIAEHGLVFNVTASGVTIFEDKTFVGMFESLEKARISLFGELSKMRLCEINCLAPMISDESTAVIIKDDVEFILDQDWVVIVEAPDGHIYQLNKKNWTAKDLIAFISKYPLEDDKCTLMFLYKTSEEYEDICLIPDEVGVILNDDEYELQFINSF